MKIIVGTRGSALARQQTESFIAALKHRAPDLDLQVRVIKTAGDKDKTRPISEIGGLGIFTKEIENALLAREIDIAVHSLKDLPTDLADGLMITAVMEREDARDCLVSRHRVGLMQLPRGARVGTSSTRRTAQLLIQRPDLQIVPLRGNVDTRLRKARSEEYDAIVLAAAGVIRLGRANEITEYLSYDMILPDPGQGALAIEIRAADVSLAPLVAQINHSQTLAAVTAERAFLRALGGGCRMPIAAYAEMRGAVLHLRGLIGTDDGKRMIRGEHAGNPRDAEQIGRALAEELLDRGGAEIMGASARNLPLQGKRILITRPREQARAFAEKLSARGAVPIEFQTIDIAPLEDFRELDNALARVSEFDWVIFTSANGVREVAERLNMLGMSKDIFASGTNHGSPRLAAIGPATAHALQDLSLHVDFIPTKYLGEQIANELPIEPGQRALLLRADIATEALARDLMARGVVVTNVDAYQIVMPPTREIDLTQVDAITFTSSSTVRNFMAMLNGKGLDALSEIRVFCIGPVTAETARTFGLRVDAVATEHTVDGLVKAIVSYYQEEGRNLPDA